MLEGVNNADFKVNQILEMQDELNKKVHPDWMMQGYRWYRAAVAEAIELTEHWGWKWWKHQEPDLDQCKLEVVDIWHFCLSDLMVQCSHDPGAVPGIVINSFLNSSNYQIKYQKTLEDTDFVVLVESFIFNCYFGRCDEEHLGYVTAKLGMDFNELYKLYVSKNVLNMFRQENGYKSGSYLKDWNGKEDNVVLMEIVNSLDVDSETFKDDILKGLQKEYKFACALDEIRRINND